MRFRHPNNDIGLTMVGVCLGLLLVCGCGHSNRPQLGIVHGVVTLDGKPLVGAFVNFEPIEPGRASAGTTDDHGKYELVYIRRDKGARVGTHRVRITAVAADKSPLVAARYNTQTTLKAEVNTGNNTLDFSLTSK